MNNEERIIDKIKKCLSLAKSSNANEAAIALRQAQNLMQKHNISGLDIDAAQASQSASRSMATVRPSQWEVALAQAAAHAFGCKALFQSFFYGEFQFIGTGSAPELSKYAFEVLLRKLKRDRSAYIKTKLYRCKRANKTARADEYCFAWVCEVHSTIAEFSLNDKQKSAIAAYMEKHHPKVKNKETKARKSTASTDAKWQDRKAGYADGKNAQLNRGVNGSKPDLLEQRERSNL